MKHADAILSMCRHLFLLEEFDEQFKYTVIEECSNEAFQALWIELHLPKHANIICGVVYRQHNSPERFQEYFEETIERFSASGKIIVLMGDTNLILVFTPANTLKILSFSAKF